ncbi:hypothetical protein AV530_009037 [Patagioenas fasciata monilis]|uniref:Uncharacterized protein n=1 Tax=Patagioenas fasciata monilis TaxID=372326 RepID=A0A1V4KQX1_PATFA|nr:hypothetical protein AV530_009037 [Patagioenas fasciata monilis]
MTLVSSAGISKCKAGCGLVELAAEIGVQDVLQQFYEGSANNRKHNANLIETRLEEPDREGEEDISRVHGVGVSHVVCLPSPLHVPCWVARHQRGLCLSVDVGRKKYLEQPEMSLF